VDRIPCRREAHGRAACVSDELVCLVIAANDAWNDKDRQKLRPYLARMIGTKDDGFDE
jgi:hypothetical protein